MVSVKSTMLECSPLTIWMKGRLPAGAGWALLAGLAAPFAPVFFFLPVATFLTLALALFFSVLVLGPVMTPPRHAMRRSSHCRSGVRRYRYRRRYGSSSLSAFSPLWHWRRRRPSRQ